MKKKIRGLLLLLLFFGLFFPKSVGADPGLEWPELNQWLEENEEASLSGEWGLSSMEDLVSQVMSGAKTLSFREILQTFAKALWGEMGRYGSLVLQVAALAILSYLLKSLSSEFAGSTVGETGFMAVYAGILLLLLNSFRIPLEITREATEKIAYLSAMLVPALAALTAASGKAVGALGHSAWILSGLSLLLTVFEKVFVALVAGLSLAEAVNYLSPKAALSRLTSLGSGLVRKGIQLLCALFLLLMGAVGMAMPAANRLLYKTGSTLISAVPVVGGALSGAMDTVLAGTVLVKNGVGAAACILLLCFCLLPLAKLAAAWLIYRLLGALLAPVSDPRTCGLAEALGRQASLLFSILTAGMVIFTGAVGVFVYTAGG